MALAPPMWKSVRSTNRELGPVRSISSSPSGFHDATGSGWRPNAAASLASKPMTKSTAVSSVVLTVTGVSPMSVSIFPEIDSKVMGALRP